MKGTYTTASDKPITMKLEDLSMAMEMMLRIPDHVVNFSISKENLDKLLTNVKIVKTETTNLMNLFTGIPFKVDEKVKPDHIDILYASGRRESLCLSTGERSDI